MALIRTFFVVKYTGRGVVVKQPGVLRKVQMLNRVLGVGVFSLLPTYPWGVGSARPNPKMGARDPENPLFPGFSVLRRGLRPWSQTMVSEEARPWGRGRSGDCDFLEVQKPTQNPEMPKNTAFTRTLSESSRELLPASCEAS